MDKWNNKRKACPGHGFWIVTNDFLIQKKHPKYCSVCGSANPRSIGEFCRWCGAHMDQEELDLSGANAIIVSVPSGAHVSEVHAEAVIKDNSYEEVK